MTWRDSWWAHQHLATTIDSEEIKNIPNRLKRWNLTQVPVRPLIERLWDSIEKDDNWDPLNMWLESISVA